jgi:predicted PurR-regulated permease PerM
MLMSNSTKDTLGNNMKPSFKLAIYSLLGLAVVYTLYFAKSLLMPVVVALLFSLLLSPLVIFFKRFYIPKILSAILLLAMIGGPVTILTIELAEPAQKWLEQLPQLSTKVSNEINSISLDVNPDTASKADKKLSQSTLENNELTRSNSLSRNEVTSVGNTLSEKIIQGGMQKIISILSDTPVIFAQFLAFIILVLFLLIFGPRLYQSYIDIFVDNKQYQQRTTLIDKLQRELSRYILTVTAINVGLGMITACVFWLLGVDDPLLWGALVGILNFAPYIGPLVALMVLSLEGATQHGMELIALLPAAAYFIINMLEAQFITPMVLGRHLHLNPLILVLWLFIWGWLWGTVGVLLAVPLLVCLKLTAGHLNIAPSFVKMIETSNR